MLIVINDTNRGTVPGSALLYRKALGSVMLLVENNSWNTLFSIHETCSVEMMNYML